MTKSKTPRTGIFPAWAQEGEDTTHTFERYATLPTPDDMKNRSLFGIPLKSQLTGQEVTNETITHYINASISELEHDLDLYITPITFDEKHDYNRRDFSWTYNYLKLNHPNIISVNELKLTFSNNQEQGLIVYPNEFVHVMPTEGVIQLVPAFGTSMSGFQVSAFSGAQYGALMALGTGSFPGGIRVNYTCGFEEGKIPASISELIENMAAYKLLSSVGPLLFPYNSIGISIDGTSQSVSSPGPQFLAQRLTDLQGIIEKSKDAVKSYYQRKFQLDSF
ncbi:hypothetical protein UFOVP53_59 [uncultured Caudovirales phage]|uniref:Uncharacterized protein n=1 Tax=uncultured Caudovirales phage TaxID=2100421 RepID=A0A6J5KW31_9CAUD|nr:hypothetical protein UFOVP53_59 [uncultured Caudovirales phage]